MISVALEAAGVDCINVSSGLRDSDHYLHDQSMASPRGSWIYLAEGVKKAVNIPVMVVKRISEDMVEGILERGQADFVCVGRPHITDPEYGKKLLSGKADEILLIACVAYSVSVRIVLILVGCQRTVVLRIGYPIIVVIVITKVAQPVTITIGAVIG